VAVNVSARQIMAPGFADVVKSALNTAGTGPERLQLELTESLYLADATAAGAVLNELHKSGVKLSLDDFGTGYSSLAYLEDFCFDSLKIDQTFTAGMVDKRNTRAIVAAVIQLAHALQITVVAEGVETERQLATLSHLGCDRAQGHLFSPALLTEDFNRHILDAAHGEPIRLRHQLAATRRLSNAGRQPK
jgi:EAL domain-containing protein (putative c-di-GMP-specific phosphodiesterase class I)